MNTPIDLLKQYSKLTGVFSLGVFGGFFLFAFAYVVVTDPGDNLTLIETEVRTGVKGERLLTGTLRNNTDEAYAFVQAEISLVDEDGRVVRDTFITKRHLEAGNTWTFDVPIRAEEAVRAILDGQCGRRYHVHGEAALRSPTVPAQATGAVQDSPMRTH